MQDIFDPTEIRTQICFEFVSHVPTINWKDTQIVDWRSHKMKWKGYLKNEKILETGIEQKNDIYVLLSVDKYTSLVIVFYYQATIPD